MTFLQRLQRAVEISRLCVGVDPVPDKLFLQTYVFYMLENGVGKVGINIRLAAFKNFSREAADMNVWPFEVPTAFSRVKKIAVRGTRSGNWLTMEQAQRLMNEPDISTRSGLRDRALLSILLGCGLRRSEAVTLTVEHFQQRNNAWVLANILGKRNKIQTVVIPTWTKKAVDAYLTELAISTGFLFRPMRKNGNVINEGHVTPREVARIVKKHAAAVGFPDIAPHDLRRTYAKLSYQNGARLDQIQINLGHESLTTTQKYLGIDLDLEDGPGSYLDIDVA